MAPAESVYPKVSIIIPVYNGGNYLCEAVESVFAQTYPNWELIVVDDGSTDQTWSMIQSYQDRLKGFHKENGGVASALNLGIRNASGTHIAWLSHDDVFLPTKLQEQITFLHNHPSYKACYTDYEYIDAKGRLLRKVQTPWYPREAAIRNLIGSMYINGSTMMIERPCFEELGLFREDLKFTQDVDMWIRILQHYEIGRLDKFLARHRLHPAQGSRDYVQHIAEEEIFYTRVFHELGPEKLLPGLTYEGNKAKTQGIAHTWFGDTMRIHRRWYAFADEHYGQSIHQDPSWSNPARFKRLANRINIGLRTFLRPLYHRLKTLLGRMSGDL